ncbi:MAG: hypothetical protein NTX61_01895 [Bacteroidetes bacterium]|nr:hypothetical protein [Bacteroidota bacterium]
MKHFIFLLIFLFSFGIVALPNPADTAIHKNRVFLEVSPGASIPLGFYSKDQISNEQSGYASPGFLLHLDCDWLGKKDFGFAIRYMYQSNPLKSHAKTDTLEGMNIPIGSGNWSNHFLLIGPVYLKSWGKLTVDIKALVGVVLATSPLFKTMDPAYHTVSGNTGMGFAFGLSGSCGYSLSPGASVFLEAGYFQGNPQINRQYGAAFLFFDPYGNPVFSAPIKLETKRTISTFNIGIGLIIKLIK